MNDNEDLKGPGQSLERLTTQREEVLKLERALPDITDPQQACQKLDVLIGMLITYIYNRGLAEEAVDGVIVHYSDADLARKLKREYDAVKLPEVRMKAMRDGGGNTTRVLVGDSDKGSVVYVEHLDIALEVANKRAWELKRERLSRVYMEARMELGPEDLPWSEDFSHTGQTARKLKQEWGDEKE